MKTDSSFRKYPTLLFVADDLSRICDSLTRLYNDSCVRCLSRADRISLSVNIQKLRAHCGTIHHYRVECDKARSILTEASLSVQDDCPF